MALTKTTTASGTFVTANSGTSAATATTYAFTAEADVINQALATPNRITNPGVFTAGTAQEGTQANPNNDAKA